MKRAEFIKHLRLRECEFLREGGNHTVYVNRREKKASTVICYYFKGGFVYYARYTIRYR